MPNKMLIDAAHPEETRVVVIRGNRVEEFDFESASRKQLRGNIYLAKVTRVEPSLQAAFVDYGGNRHGFLAFSEIHPDYYQIPVADRQALIEAEEREIAEEAHATEADDTAGEAEGEGAAATEGEAAAEGEISEGESASETMAETAGATAESVSAEPEQPAPEGAGEEPAAEEPRGAAEEVLSDDRVESVGAEDALEELPERRKARARQYKIQEVIKRRQVLLVQVVKEERGNKGAALTTYLSLAGRYSVLMPNTARGGGISRKITSPTDRKRLKQVATDLEVPEGMGVILRTAGASRTKAEVKRDFEYLLRLWENVRELTLRSTAPTLVYEEGSLIKRSIRDLYNKDIDEILVAGDDAYREAKDFMRMLMPSHAKNVQPYRDKQPLFARNGIEAQLDAMFSPQVTLRSGGYLVINQTEALVSIDVNSGRATREHNIEDTAYQTNLEAAEELARQLRLRDLAGLIVIDFIDMEEKRNNRAVERKMKDALKNDRARIQVGRISHFGLLEMSRQRIRTGVLESTTSVCQVCQGTGHVRAPASVSLHVLRSIEDQLLKGVSHHLTIRTRTPVALYILNQKRPHLSELEHRFGLTITVLADELINNAAHFTVERGEPIEPREVLATSVQPDSVQPIQEEEDLVEAEPVYEEEEEVEEQAEGAEHIQRGERGEEAGEAGGRKRRRRRRRKGPEEAGRPAEPIAARAEEGAADEEERGAAEAGAEPLPGETSEELRKRRRGRRGGRRGRRGRGGEERGSGERVPRSEFDRPVAALTEQPAAYAGPNGGDMAAPEFELPRMANQSEEPDPRPTLMEPAMPEPAIRLPEPPAREPESAKPQNVEATMRPAEPREERAAEPTPPPAPEPPRTPEEDADQPKRGGWWQRRSFF
jgi:ribonuclease E